MIVSRAPRTRRPPQEAGGRAFTLLEILIALVLLSLLIAVAVPSLGAVTGARMKENAGLLTGAIRDTYARTALIGRSTRIVFDFDQNAWWIEESPTVARLHNTKLTADRDGRMKLDAVDERLDNIEADTQDEEERAKLELLSPPSFQPVEGEDGKPHVLPGDVRFKDIWVEHIEDKQKGGQVALYFFPGGFTEEALITLTDDDQGEDSITLVVSSLTGEVEISEDELRVPELEED